MIKTARLNGENEIIIYHLNLSMYIDLVCFQVAWIKSDTKAVLAIHTHMVALNSRLSVSHNGHDTWKLYISNVQANDSGIYMCQVNTDPMRSQVGP